jgi:glycosyltransferase involved in cell wall biosynthesis
LVGACDPCNPTSFTEAEARQWEAAGQAEWLGRRADVLEQMSAAWLVVLPSYREGLPKVLLEAGVAQRAVVTCDVVGCRELVTHEVNGLLVPPKAPAALADAMERLLKDHELRRALAQRLRELVCREFSQGVVNHEFLKLYQKALHTRPVPA